MPTRRNLLKLGAVGGAAALLPWQRLLAAGEPASHLAHRGILSDVASPQTEPFQVALPIPATARPVRRTATTDYYRIVMREGRQEIIPGKQTTVWGYDGLFPGPTVRTEEGRRVVVRHVNNLPEPMSVHQHGGHTKPQYDGHPTDLIPPSGFKDYIYTNRHPAATLWYHDHANHVTGEHVYKGLAGFWLVRNRNERSLPLPAGQFDVPLVLQDRLFNPDGSFFYPRHDGGVIQPGVVGDTLLVNGAVQPFFRVANRKYRFRILNGSNARVYGLQLSSGDPITQIASDGGLLRGPTVRNRIPLAPAERVEVVIDFSRYPVGSSVVLESFFDAAGLDLEDFPVSLVRFDVVRREADPSSIPGLLHDFPIPPESSAVRTREFEFHRSGSDAWSINGLVFDENRVDARPKLGTNEIWKLVNGGGGWVHPIHIHLNDFFILDRNGKPPIPAEAGLKDTVLLNPNDVVRILMAFEPFTGTYVFHCHNLEHEDHDMMGQFEVIP